MGEITMSPGVLLSASRTAVQEIIIRIKKEELVLNNTKYLGSKLVY